MMDSYYPFNNLPTKYHLGTSCILFEEKGQPPSMLGIFHAKWEGPPGAYKHYAYTFSAQPPFQLLKISRREFALPCSAGHEVVFIPSLELLASQTTATKPEQYLNQEVLLGYGVDDKELYYAKTTLRFLVKDLVNVDFMGPQCLV